MAIESPCVGLCRFDGRTGYCTACLRTLEEARTWKKIGDPKRHRIINDRARRSAKLAVGTQARKKENA